MNARMLFGTVMAALSAVALATASDPAPAKKTRCYDLKVQIYQHVNGQKKMLCSPQLRVCDGQSSCLNVGGMACVPAMLARGSREFIPFGLSFDAHVTTLDRDRVKLEITFGKRELESTTKTGVRLNMHGAEATELAFLGTPVVMVMDADSKESATIVEVVVERAPDMTLAPGRPAKHPSGQIPVRVPDQPMSPSGQDDKP